MKKRELLIILGLAILVEVVILGLFEPEPPLIGGPVTFPISQFKKLLWRLGFGVRPDLPLILAVIFWFLVLASVWFLFKGLRKRGEIKNV